MMIKNDDWTWTQETLKSIIADIIERMEEYQKEEKTEYDQGIIFGYSCVIDSIRNELESRGYDFQDFLTEENKNKEIELTD